MFLFREISFLDEQKKVTGSFHCILQQFSAGGKLFLYSIKSVKGLTNSSFDEVRNFGSTGPLHSPATLNLIKDRSTSEL